MLYNRGMNTNQILRVVGTDYKAMTKELCTRAELCSMIPAKESKVAIKPNLVVAGPAELGATTHRGVVAGIIEYLNENGYKNLVVIESAWYGEDTENALMASGFDSLLKEYKWNIGIASGGFVPFANRLKEAILEAYPTAEVICYPVRGLCSFYCERGGICISVEC